MLNIIPMVSTKNIAIEYKQKGMKKEFKHFSTKKKKKLNAKEDSNIRSGKQSYKIREIKMTESSSYK